MEVLLRADTENLAVVISGMLLNPRKKQSLLLFCVNYNGHLINAGNPTHIKLFIIITQAG